MPRKLQLYLATVGIAVLAMGSMLAVAELYLRRFVFDPRQPYVRTPGWELVVHTSEKGTPGVSGVSHIKINALGLRGDLPNGTASPAIMTIGGSTTEDLVLNDPDTWSGQLQARLRRCHPNAWVGNAGKSGTAAPHHVLVAQHMLNRLARLDRVVVLLGLNDMLYDQRIHLGDTKLPPDWDLRQAFMFVPSNTWYQRFALFQLAGRFLTAMSLGKVEASKIQIVDFGEINFNYRKRRAAVMHEDWIRTAPDLRGNLARFRTNLVSLVELAKARGVALTFLTQPALWKPVMSDGEQSLLYAGGVAPTDLWSTNARIKWYAVEPMRQMLEAYNDVTRGICSERNLPCIDLARLLPSEAANYFDDFHFSKAGASEVGRIVASGLAPSC